MKTTRPTALPARTLIHAACVAALLWPAVHAQAQVTATWTGASGDLLWNTPGNWIGGVPGTNPGDTAIFNTSTAPALAGQTIVLSTPITLGHLNTAGTAAAVFTISGGSILFDNGAAPAQIQFAGNNAVTLASAVALNSDLDVIGVSPSARLTLAGAIAGSGRKLSNSGVGTLLLAGNGKTFDGGFEIFAGKVETTLAAAGNAAATLGAVDAATNLLGGGNLSTGNAGTELEIKSSGGGFGNQSVSLNGSTLTAEFGATIRLTEQDARNAFTLNLNGGTLDGGTNAARGTLHLSGTDLAFNANGLGGSAIVNTPGLVFDTSANASAMRVTLNGGTLGGFGAVRKTGPNTLDFVDAGSFGASQLSLEGGRTNFGLATLNLANGLVFADPTAMTSLLSPTGVASFGRADQMLSGGNHLGTAAGATGSLLLGGFDQHFGNVTLGANSRLNLYLQPAAPAPMTLAIGALSGSGLAIHGWRGNPDTHAADGNAALTDNVSFGSATLADVWFRGFDPGAVVGAGGVLRPVDFLHTGWTGNAGSFSGTTNFRWFDLANWSVDAPNHAGAVASFGALPNTVVATLEARPVTIGHLVTQSTGKLQLTGGTLVFDSGVAGTASTITGAGNATLVAPVELHNALTINTGAAISVSSLAGTGNIAIDGGGLSLAGANPGYVGDLSLNAGRLSFSNAQGLGPATNTLRLNGGEVYAGNNSLNAKAIANRVEFNGDFTAGYILFDHAGDVSWTGTRSITGDGTVGFGQGLRLTGSGALVVQGGVNSGIFDFQDNNNDFSGGLTVLPRLGYGSGSANVTLRGDLVTGALAAGQNHLGSGAIVARAAINVNTQGHASSLLGSLTLGNGANAVFSGGGSVSFGATASLVRDDTSTAGLVTDGDLAIDGATLSGKPHLSVNPAAGSTHTIHSNAAGGIAGVGTFTKSQGGVTVLDTALAADAYVLAGGTLRLNRDAAVNGTAPLTISGGVLQSAAGSAGAPVTNRFGVLSLSSSASLFLNDHSAFTFSSGSWVTGSGISLNLQNNTGIWSTAAAPTLSDTYARFTSSAGLSSARLAEVAFTGYERGAVLVPQTVSGSNYWFLAPSPTSNPLIEWKGAVDTGVDTDRLWSTGSNWIGNVAPNAAGRSAAVRDLDGLLTANTIVVDAPVTIGKLFIESNSAQAYSIASRNGGSLGFDNNGAGALLSVSGDNTAELSADVRLLAADPLALKHLGKQVFTLSGKVGGSGGIVSDYAGPGTTAHPDAGVLRFSGNAGSSDYTGGFWIKGATGNNVSATRAAREIRIAGDGTLFGLGSSTGDPATSTQALHLGESSTNSANAAAWYRLVGEGGAHTVNASVRFDGNLYHSAVAGLTFQSTDASYVTAGLKSLSGDTTLSLRTPIAGPGGFQFGGSNQSVNFYGANSFAGGIYFLQSYSPNLGLGADNALGTGTITYENVNIGNSPVLKALDGARTLANPFDFKSPVGVAKTTARFSGDITLDHVGSSQLEISPGLNVDANSTLAFGSSHVLEGAGGLIKNGTGTLRLQAANTYLGDTDLALGTLQVGHDQALGTTGRLLFSGSSSVANGTLASVGGARTLANRVVFDAPVLGLDGSLGLLTLAPSAANGDTPLAGPHSLNVTGPVAFGADLRLSGSGSLAKTGNGTLTLNSGNASYSGGSSVNRGTLQVIANGDITLGRSQAGQNYLGTGAVTSRPLVANPGVESLVELVLPDGASVHIGGNLDVTGISGLGRAGVNVTSTAGTVTGANIKTYFDATQTISGTSFGTLRTPGDLVKTGAGTTTTVTGDFISTPNLVVDSGTLTLAAGGLASKIQNLTIGNGTLKLDNNQSFAPGSAFNLTGTGTVDMGNKGFLTLGTVGSWNPAGALNITQWNGTTLTGGGASQFRFTSDVTGLFSDAMLSSVIITGGPGTSYAPGAIVVRNVAGYYELLPSGVGAEWDHGGSGYNWTTAQNWKPDTQPSGVGAAAVIGDLDTALNGKTINVDGANIVLGSLAVRNTTGASFTIAGAPIRLQQVSAAANAVISVTGNSTPTVASDLLLENDLLVSQRGTGTLSLNGVISGAHGLIKDGPRTLVLGGVNTYSGGTQLLDGALVAGADHNLGDAAGPLAFDGGTLQLGGAFDLAATRSLTMGTRGGSIDTGVHDSRITQSITGAGGLTKLGSGRLTLAGDNGYAGVTTISAGTLQIGNGGTSGSVIGDIANNAALVVDRSNDLAYDGVISGSGTLDKRGAGRLTLTGDHLYSGSTTVSAGTLRLGDGGTSGSIAGPIVDNAALVFDRSDDIVHGGTISGSGTLAKQGAGELTLTGASTYGGATTVSGGTLLVNGSLTTPTLSAASGTTFGGQGSVAGDVSIAANARLSPGDGSSTGVLSLGSLVLDGASQLDYHFGLPNVIGFALNDRVDVARNLTLDGTLNITDIGGFGQGVYRLFNYGGTLTDNGLGFGAFPAGFNTADFSVQTAAPGQVNLVVSTGGLLNQFWDGTQTSANNLIDGGDGTWTLPASNWTNAAANVNAQWAQFGFAIFAGSAGTVTLGDTVTAGGLQFITDGYRITAGATAHTLQAEPDFIVRADAGVTATVSAPIVDSPDGAARLTKTDTGTLVLAGANTYSGGTRVHGGTLQIAADAHLGAAGGALELDDGTLHTTADLASARSVTLGAGGGSFRTDANTTLTLSSAIGGSGKLTKLDAGTLLLTNDNTYAGGTLVAGGTLQIGNGGTTGSVQGGIHVNSGSSLSFFRSDARADITNAITGDGTIRLLGNGVRAQSGYAVDATHSGFTGNLVIGSGARLLVFGASPVATAGVTVEDQGTLFLSNDTVYASPIAMEGDGWLDGPGRLGALRMSNGATVSGPVTLTRSARINTHAAGDSGIISGAIGDGGHAYAIEKNGSGTLILAGTNTYTGSTTVSDGTLQIGNGGTTGSVAGDIVDNAVLVFKRSDALVFGGALSGSGSLEQAGSGTLTLTGNATHAGGTTVSAGTLQLGDGGTSGGVLGDITDNAALVFNRSDTVAYGNVVGGSGRVEQAGSGTLVLTGTHAYTGGTTISAGTLQLGDGGTTGSVLGDIVDNGALVFKRSDAVTLAATVSGSGSLEQAGSGTLVLDGSNTHRGGTLVSSGVLQVSRDANLGAAGGALAFNSGTLRFAAAFYTDRAVTLNAGGTGTIDSNGFDVAFGSRFSGDGALVKAGAGTLTLASDNTYTGGTTVRSGTLQLGSGGTTGSVSGGITVDDTLVYFQSGADTLLANPLLGTGTVRFRGTGVAGESGYRFTVPNAGFGGIAVVEAGARLSLNEPGLLGSAGPTLQRGVVVQNGGSLVVSGSDTWSNSLSIEGLGWREATGEQLGALRLVGSPNVASALTLTGDARITTQSATDSGTLSGAIGDGGAGYGFDKTGAGRLILDGSGSYTGGTAVSAGTLLVNGSLASSALNVASGATLGGIGVIAGSVNIAGGGHLAPGTSPGTLGTGSLVLQPGAILDYELNGDGALGGPVDDLVNVDGDLTLGGTLNVSSTRAGGLGIGVYRLINYTGSWANRGTTLALGTVPAGNQVSGFLVQTAIPQQVNLIHTAGLRLAVWDGGDPALHDNSAIDGNNGLWNLSNQDWTAFDGVSNAGWSNNSFAIFAATPGTVSVDNSFGVVDFAGAQFVSDGYVIAGQPLTTSTADTVIRVGDGSGPSASYVATIDAVITGGGGLHKSDVGTLVLGAENTYAGGTTITGGTLQIGHGGASGSVVGGIVDNSALAFNRSDDLAVGNDISGTGSLRQRGPGTLRLTGATTWTGGTVVSGGTLEVANGGTLATSADGIPAVQAITGGTARLNGMNVATSGAAAHGLVVSGGSRIALDGSSVAVQGAGSAGLLAIDGGVNSVSLSGGSLSSGQGSAIAVSGATLDLALSNGARAEGGLLLDARSGAVASVNAGGNAVLVGDVQADAGSSLRLNLAGGTVWSGAARNAGAVGLSNSMWWVTGNSDVASLSLDPSQVVFAPPVNGVFKALTVRGDFGAIGSGNTITVNTVLNGGGALAAQQTDRLLVGGNVLGQAQLAVRLAGQTPATTDLNGNHLADANEGISLAQVAGQASAGSFQLAGGGLLPGTPFRYQLYSFAPGLSDPAQRVVPGAGGFWDYRLANEYVAPTPGDDPSRPGLVPQAPAYLSLPTALTNYQAFVLDSLHQRLGEVRSSDLRNPELGAQGEGYVRLIAGRGQYRSDQGFSDFGYDFAQDNVALQFGGHLYRRDSATETLRIGGALTVADGSANSMDVQAVDGNSTTQLSAWGLAVTGTWLRADGWYADGVAMVNKFSDEVSTSLQGTTATVKGWGTVLSLEGGYTHALGRGWFVEPQGQLAWQHIRLDDVTDKDQIALHYGDTDVVIGRVGLRFGKDVSIDKGGLTPYAKANLVFSNDRRTQLNLGGTTFEGGGYGQRWELGAGVTSGHRKDMDLFADLTYGHEMGHGTRTRGLQAIVGWRWRF